ncbi:MAG: extracellular solute-binding protein [Chloroflexi bacterium]|nr:extracellular solute-binding protein [Chloroflexota bacterium]
MLWGTTGSEAPQYLAPFIQRYPWLKVEIQDLSSEPLAEKVIAEFKAGKHNWDLMTQSEEMMTVMPIRDLVTPYEWPNVVGKWPASAVGPDNLYIRNHVTPMGVIYNSKIISPADAPKSWEDLLNPKWKGKTAASKSSDEAPLALAAWWGKDGGLDWDRSFKFWEDVFKITQPRVVSGYTGPMQTLLVAGEFQIMVYGSAGSAAMLQLVNKLPVEIAAMDRILGKSNTYSISKNAQHPNAARMLVDYMTSTEGSTLHSEVSIKIPLNPKVTNSKVVDFFNKKGQVLNISKFITKENMAKSSAFWNKLLGL